MLTNIALKNYRNIKYLDTQISPQGNIIVAPNGSGKTNLLESVYFSVFGDSFKPTESISELIGPDENYAKSKTKWNSDILEVTVSNLEKLNRNYSLNTKKTPISKISAKFPIILFAPHTVDLVIGEPQTRRGDLNAFLSILNPDYRKLISSYTIILKNRNAVIKQIREGKLSENMLDFWTDKIVEVASLIYQQRNDFFEDIKDFFIDAQNVLFGLDNFTLQIEYIPNLKPQSLTFKEELLLKYNSNKTKEIIVGKTLYGVHKDDFQIILNGGNLKFKGSRGQQRIGISVFKFAELLLYYKKFNVYPLLLLDDIMSELDDQNRNRIASYLLEKNLQFIITSAEDKEVPAILKENSKNIDIMNSTQKEV